MTLTAYYLLGACGYLNIVPGTANIVNQVFIKFLSRLQHTKSEFVAPSISSIHDRMAQALVQLSEIVGDRTIATKDPMSSLSFSCTAPDVVKSQDESLRQFRKGEHTAFVPLTRQKRPIRRYVLVKHVNCNTLTHCLTIASRNGQATTGSTVKRMVYRMPVCTAFFSAVKNLILQRLPPSN